MSINISQAFHRTSANPVDESMALTKTQMLAVNDNLMPAYYFTICQDDGEVYLYDKTATPSSTTGKFTKFEGSGGHTILDSSGTATAQESNLQFTGLSVIDDSVNEKTEVAGEGLNAESINDIAEANSTVPAVVIGDANNYSTTEKVVGKWIDGKPLYQITVDCGMGKNATAWTTTVNISNVENIIYMEGIALGTETKPVPFVHPGGLAYQIQVDAREFTTSSFGVLINITANYTDQHFYVTVRYTKTTD